VLDVFHHGVGGGGEKEKEEKEQKKGAYILPTSRRCWHRSLGGRRGRKKGGGKWEKRESELVF